MVKTSYSIETSGVLEPQTMVFPKDLGPCLAQVMGDKNTTNYLLQKLSVAVLQRNFALVLGPRAICLAQRHYFIINCMHVYVIHD